MSSLFRTIVQDATHYFLIIFTSHLVLSLTLILGRVRVSSRCHIFSFSLAGTFVAFDSATPRPVSDNRAYLLSMFANSSLYGTAQIVCTSKHLLVPKAAGTEPLVRYLPVMIARLMLSLRRAATLQESPWSFGEPSIRFAEPQGPAAMSDEMCLDTFSSRHVGARSQA